MKRIIYSLLLPLVFIVSCSNEDDVKLEAYSPEVFAYDIGDEYEVNATVRIKGFQIKGEGEEFTSSVGYELDLVRPGGAEEKSFYSQIEDFNFSEKVNDTGLDIQFNLDSTYQTGKYTLVFNLKDNFSGKTASTSAEFSLGE